MRRYRIAWYLFGLCLFLGVMSATFSQNLEVRMSPAKDQVVTTREIIPFSYPELGTGHAKLQGTYRLPQAKGEISARRTKGMTQVDAKLENMRPAHFFGGDYNTYVLWIISPEGLLENAGEIMLDGSRSKHYVETPLRTFGMFVTAEPHYLVTSPSRFIVLENVGPSAQTGMPAGLSKIKYQGDEGVYAASVETLVNMPEVRGRVTTDLGQARTAVKLAEQAGADQYAPREMAKAKEELRQLEIRHAVDRNRPRDRNGREVVLFAVQAQWVAEQRASEVSTMSEDTARSKYKPPFRPGAQR